MLGTRRKSARGGALSFASAISLICAAAAAASATIGCSAFDAPATRTTSAPPISYCPYLPSLVFTGGVTVSGKAYYQYRINGNGEVQDGGARVEVATVANSTLYTVTIGGTGYDYTSDGTATKAEILAGLAAAINADSANSGAAATATAADLRIVPTGVPSPALSASVTANLTLFAHAAPNPIRHAEIRVNDASGSITQCAETASDGSFSFQLPANSGTYSVNVASRSSNASLQAYILQDPNTNAHYSLTQSVATASSTSGLLFVASATSAAIEGGAFNILDQLHVANDFLRAELATCNTPSDTTHYFAGCPQGFSVAPMLYAYWKKGVNPGTYFGNSNPVSFYLLGTGHLFLLCQSGETGDCDHFDNSVIVHEYGHFIEDSYAHPDSPGGSHNGSYIIDARLAWGEGWADFFQAAATGQPFYRDAIGTIDCYLLNGGTKPTPGGGGACTDYAFSENLETNASVTSTSSDPSTFLSAQYDSPVRNGEGNFHEFSISRVLWHALDKAQYYPAGSTTHSTANFGEIWTALANPSVGFANSGQNFRSVGLLHKIQQAQTGATDWSTIRTNEKHAGDLSGYATPVTLGTTACAQTITMRNTDYGSALSLSDQFNNNDFYDYSHAGGALSVQIACTANCATVALRNTYPDLDIYVWKAGYSFGLTAGLVASSAVASTSNESTSVSLPAGHYLINVNADPYTASSPPYATATQYQLSINGSKACPNP